MKDKKLSLYYTYIVVPIIFVHIFSASAQAQSEPNENNTEYLRTEKATLENFEQEGMLRNDASNIPFHPDFENEKPTIEFHYENADLNNLVKQMEDIYGVTFITDDAIYPIGPQGKAIAGNKISFQTNRPLSKNAAWNLFLRFLDLAGLSLVADKDPKIFHIVSVEVARKSALSSFIGVPHQTLPDNDERIRYIYFVENSTIEAIQSVVEALKSPTSTLVILKDLKAFMITDKAYNIKMLMTIVKELDKVSMPQSMSVLKLRRTDAQQVKQLYDSLIQTQESDQPSKLVGPRKEPTALYFPENTRIIAEPRTNALILLGTKDSIKKIEDFITKYVDVELDQAYSPLHVHQLQYADATTVANIMTNVTQFGKETEAGKSGGVRGGDKFLRAMSFVPEKETNRLIIRGDYDDYLRSKEIIDLLDQAQPQVAIEVLILSIDLANTKELGAQIRNKVMGADGLLGKNVNFQTSGLFAGGSSKGIVEKSDPDSGSDRLLGNLINLASGAPAGNTIISLGKDACGVWGILQALQTVANVQVVSNPFLFATNKTKAKVSLGEIRRVVTSQIVGGGNNTTNTFDDTEAKLTVNITPQINSDGMIILNLDIEIVDFVQGTDEAKNTKEIITKAIVANEEVLALGGLIKNNITEVVSKTPILGDIPILGWIFKNKRKIQIKSNLLILISTTIINPSERHAINEFTQQRIIGYQEDNISVKNIANKDPINKMFFEGKATDTENSIDDFIFKRHHNTQGLQKNPVLTAKEKRKKQRKENRKSSKKKHKGRNRSSHGHDDSILVATTKTELIPPAQKQAAPLHKKITAPVYTPTHQSTVALNTKKPQLSLTKSNKEHASLSTVLSNEKTKREVA